MTWLGKYGLRIVDSVRYGNQEKYYEVIHCHTLVADYLDKHLDQHKELLFDDGTARYYDVLKLAMTPEEWKEFLKPKPWEAGRVQE